MKFDSYQDIIVCLKFVSISCMVIFVFAIINPPILPLSGPGLQTIYKIAGTVLFFCQNSKNESFNSEYSQILTIATQILNERAFLDS